MQHVARMAAWVTVIGCLHCGSPAPAQAPTADARQRIVQIYGQAQKVQTVAQCTQVLDQCRAAGAGQLATPLRQYLDQLEAWVLNKRGELRVAEGDAAAAAGQAEQAQQAESAALDDFQQALKRQPDYWRARHNRGVSLAMAGQLDEAIADFSVSLQQNSSYKNSWFNRAEIYYQQGRFEAALADYNKVIALDGEDAGAYAGRAHTQFELGQYDAALADYERLLQLAPDDAHGYADRADLHALLGHWRDAAQDYRQAIRLDNKLARAYQNAAWMMATCPDARYRNAALAVRAAERAIALVGTPDYQGLDTLAAAQAAAGKFDAAQATMQKALALAPQTASEDLQVRLASYRQQQPYTQPSR